MIKLLSIVQIKEVTMSATHHTDAFSFPARLRQLRKNRDWSQGQLAQKVQIDTQRISKYERGTTSPPIDVLVKLARALEVSLDYLLTGTSFGAEKIKNPKLIERVEEIEELPEDYQEILVSVLDSFIKRYKFEQLAKS